jgi:hypothetical protein
LSTLLGQLASVDLPPVAVDLVVLAGDMDRGIKGVVWARQAFPDVPLLYVAGNPRRRPRLLETAAGGIG